MENKTMTIPMTANVNPTSRTIPEITYNNNMKSASAKVQTYNVPCRPRTYVKWTEYRKKSDYKSGKKVKTYKQCNKKGCWVVGYDVKFYAKLNTSTTMVDRRTRKKTMKSGYGLVVEANTNISTNYDRSLGNTRRVEVVFEDRPKETVRMERYKGKWILPINREEKSVINDRVHFVPINWKDDTKLKGKIKVEGASTPAGTLRDCIDQSVTIKGNMYEDDYTTPSRKH